MGSSRVLVRKMRPGTRLPWGWLCDRCGRWVRHKTWRNAFNSGWWHVWLNHTEGKHGQPAEDIWN